MYNHRLYEIAYHNLKSQSGNMTPGLNPTTLDNFSSSVIKSIIENMRDQSFQFKPGRRTQISKTSFFVRNKALYYRAS
jgi:hypothetical protein